MGLDALREFATTVMFDVIGVDITVTPPGGSPVTAKGIWLAPLATEEPVGGDLRRREMRRVMSLPKASVATARKGAAVVAPESTESAAVGWRVDGYELGDVDEHRVILVRDATLDP